MSQFNLLGEIVADDSQKWFSSDVVPAMVIGWLAKQDGDIEVNINSPGGDVTAGLAIANALKGYDKGKVTANVLGIAASMASVVACACDEVKMGKGAFVMIHNPWGVAVGEAEELRHQADVMDKMKESIIGFYQSKFKVPAMELAKLMDDETWIADTDCELYGFSATPYAEDFKVAACATRHALDHAPEAARAFFAVREKPKAEQAAPVQGQEAPVDWEARYKGLMAKYNAERDERAKQAQADQQAFNDKLNDLAEKYAAAVQELTVAHQAEIKDLNDQLGAVRADLETARADLSSVTARAEKAETDLAAKGEQLERLEKAHALLTGGVLNPGACPDAEAEYQAALKAAKSPEQREEIRKAHRNRAK